MFAKPSLAVTKQLFDLVLADPVMLVVIQHRNQNVEMGQQIAQSTVRFQCRGEIGALAPFRKLLIERMSSCRHFVAERLEESPQNKFSAATRHNGNARFQRQRRLCEFVAFFASSVGAVQRSGQLQRLGTMTPRKAGHSRTLRAHALRH